MKNPSSTIYDTNCLPGMQNKRKRLIIQTVLVGISSSQTAINPVHAKKIYICKNNLHPG